MTDLRQAAQQALEALEAVHTDFVCRATHHKKKDQHGGLDICPNATRHITAITALQAALEQQAEPVAVYQWRKQGCADWYDGHPDYSDCGGPYETRSTQSNPPQRQWVGLEPEEILDLFDRNNVYGSKWIEFARTVEAKLKEKNDH